MEFFFYLTGTVAFVIYSVHNFREAYLDWKWIRKNRGSDGDFGTPEVASSGPGVEIWSGTGIEVAGSGTGSPETTGGGTGDPK
jgi:hypothetical protein